MSKSLLLCAVLLFALNEPGCETNTSDAKSQVHQPAKPEPGCANLNCTELAPAATPTYNEPTPTFEPKEEN